MKQINLSKERNEVSEMAKTNEMTNAKALEFVLEMKLPEDVKEKIQNMHASLVKKSANRKPKDDTENAKMRETILAILSENGGAMSATEIFTADTSLKSTPKVTSLLKVLMEQGKVVRTEVKGKPFFELA